MVLFYRRRLSLSSDIGSFVKIDLTCFLNKDQAEQTTAPASKIKRLKPPVFQAIPAFCSKF